MKVKVIVNGVTYKATMPYEGATFVEIQEACPCCGHAGPTKVHGIGNYHNDYDTHYSDAGFPCCHYRSGTIEAKVNTLFGIDEDRAVGSLGVRIF